MRQAEVHELIEKSKRVRQADRFDWCYALKCKQCVVRSVRWTEITLR
jgi:hypothetical protein